jgi:hypothetical protein
MKLPQLQKPQKYFGLYVFDFVESQRYKNCKAYKIHRAYPDGRLELKGVRAEIFQLDAGMFFYANDLETVKQDFKGLVNLAVKSAPPCRAKVHLAKYNDNKFVTALIYPAEYDEEISAWLLDADYKTTGAAEGGIEAVQRYYDYKPKILDRHQLFGKSENISRSGQELLASVKLAVQR